MKTGINSEPSAPIDMLRCPGEHLESAPPPPDLLLHTLAAMLSGLFAGVTDNGRILDPSEVKARTARVVASMAGAGSNRGGDPGPARRGTTGDSRDKALAPDLAPVLEDNPDLVDVDRVAATIGINRWTIYR